MPDSVEQLLARPISSSLSSQYAPCPSEFRKVFILAVESRFVTEILTLDYFILTMLT